jgi:hypothetical protein
MLRAKLFIGTKAKIERLQWPLLCVSMSTVSLLQEILQR